MTEALTDNFNQDLVDFFTSITYTHNPHKATNSYIGDWLAGWMKGTVIGAYDRYPEKLDKSFRWPLIDEQYDKCIDEEELHLVEVAYTKPDGTVETFHEFGVDLDILHFRLYDIKERLEKAAEFSNK